MKSKSQVKAEILKYVILTFASLVMAIDYRTFVEWGNLYPGGAVGLAMLVQRVSQSICDSLGWNVTVPFSPINVALNAIPVWIGFKYIGRKFTLQSLYVIFMSGFLADLVPVDLVRSVIPAADLVRFESDPFITSLFGGIVFGFGIALCLRCNATSGGTDFIAIYLSQKRGVETWNLVLGFNVVILLIAGYFFGWERALYSIIYQYVSTQTLHVLYRSYQKQTLFVVTDKAPEVCEAIHNACNHGATVYDAEGSFSHRKLKMVYSIISGTDVKPTLTAIKEADPDAFVNSIRTSEIRGHFYMKPKD